MNSILFYLSFLLSFVSFSVHLGYGWILLRFALNCGGNKQVIVFLSIETHLIGGTMNFIRLCVSKLFTRENSYHKDLKM